MHIKMNCSAPLPEMLHISCARQSESLRHSQRLSKQLFDAHSDDRVHGSPANLRVLEVVDVETVEPTVVTDVVT